MDRELITPYPLTLQNTPCLLDPSGALLLEGGRTLVVADLHLEKGAAYARRGVALPPYDTLDTLVKLRTVLERCGPERVVSLGDSFHDRRGAATLEGRPLELLRGMLKRYAWVWVEGNHEGSSAACLGGECAAEIEVGNLALRHEPMPKGELPRGRGQLAGHLHPKARLPGRSRAIPCFASDGKTLILPAFGCLTGGLDVSDPAYRAALPGPFNAYLLGGKRIHAVSWRFLSKTRGGHVLERA